MVLPGLSLDLVLLAKVLLKVCESLQLFLEFEHSAAASLASDQPF